MRLTLLLLFACLVSYGQNVKISDMPAASNLAGAVVPIVQGGINKKANAALFLPTGAALSRVNDTNLNLTLGGSPTTALLSNTSLTLSWAGTLSGDRGGTGVANIGKTITLGGNLTYSGAVNTTFVMTGSNVITFPNSSITVARTDASQVFSGTQTFSSAPNFTGASTTGYVWTAVDNSGNGVWSSAGGGVAWGFISGTLSSQLDLNSALNARLTVANNLSDLASTATARTNLGLGSLATQSGTFSGTSSGTNSGDQTIILTGDVTGSGTGSFATAISSTLKNSWVTSSVAGGTGGDPDNLNTPGIHCTSYASGTSHFPGGDTNPAHFYVIFTTYTGTAGQLRQVAYAVTGGVITTRLYTGSWSAW